MSKTKPAIASPAAASPDAATADSTPASPLAWPMEGGCWIRLADGSLVRDNTADPVADPAPQE